MDGFVGSCGSVFQTVCPSGLESGGYPPAIERPSFGRGGIGRRKSMRDYGAALCARAVGCAWMVSKGCGAAVGVEVGRGFY